MLYYRAGYTSLTFASLTIALLYEKLSLKIESEVARKLTTHFLRKKQIEFLNENERMENPCNTGNVYMPL